MMPKKILKEMRMAVSKMMRLFTPTSSLNSGQALATPLKKGGDVKHYIPSPFRGRARVGVKTYPARTTINTSTIKTLTTFSAALFISVFALQLQAETQTNQQFGRLFSKPNERANLNILRQNQKLKTSNTPETVQAETTTEPVELTDPVTLQGYVKRSDGASTLWVNNQAVQENSTVDNIKIGRLNQRGFSQKGANTEGIDVKLPANGKHIRLKAGQMYEPESNQVIEMQVVEKAKRLRLEESGVVDGDAQPSVSKAGNQVE